MFASGLPEATKKEIFLEHSGQKWQTTTKEHKQIRVESDRLAIRLLTSEIYNKTTRTFSDLQTIRNPR